MDSEIEDLLDFWFGPARYRPDALPDVSSRWFSVDPAFDDTLRSRFGELWQRARDHMLDQWAETPEGRLALIILLDQMSRNLCRSTPQAFTNDERALELTMDGLSQGVDKQLSPIERGFLLMPMQHAEDLSVQRHSVAEYRRLLDEVPTGWRDYIAEMLAYAEEHRDLIERFGRFPHRNGTLGRSSTEQERAFLDSGATGYGQ